tara:strand:+ start:247 stop:900 length:654 start_codon:yes stop_codon:yes gene_type:complete
MGLGTAATIGLVGSAAGMVAGGIQAGVGRSREKAAKTGVSDALGDLRTMITEGQTNRLKALQVPTMGAELQERALARATAGQVEAMQEAGAAGVIGGAGRVTQAAGEAAAQQAAQVDQMQKQRDQLVLQEEQRLEGQKYQGLLGLQQMELTGAQQAVADAQAQKQAGVTSAFGALSQGVGLMASQANPYQGSVDIDAYNTWKKSNPAGTFEDFLKTL